ncbi:hypothetical protein CJU89_4819 [Yarrowia sp. B02]|nr:hypothetical protein CJU89_4819 [Yarrowia sp. B02]
MERQKELETEILVELAKINETALLINENVLKCTELLNGSRENGTYSQSTNPLCDSIQQLVEDMNEEPSEDPR